MAKKSKTPSFVLERCIHTTGWMVEYLNKILNACNKLYNIGVKHYLTILDDFAQDDYYQDLLIERKSTTDEDELKLISKEISACMSAYGLNEYDIHEFFGKVRAASFKGCIGANVAQKLATSLYQAISKSVFSGTKVHYRKRGQTNSFEDKKASVGIIYHSEDDTVRINGHSFPLKPIRKNDVYMQEAMTRKIKYCRVVRKYKDGKCIFFVQFVMEGVPPEKHRLGKGICGVDEGVSTVCFINDAETDFVVLAKGVEKYDKAIHDASVSYERKMRLNNPDCYNSDGTLKKGAKLKVRSKNSFKALMQLKSAYRKKTVFVKQQHNRLANRIIENCDTIIKEPMDYKALAKKSKKPPERQNNFSTVKKKNGKTVKVHKFKRKKRFGKSILRRSPGLFNQTLETKITALGGTYINVNRITYKASQYNHVTGEYIPTTLDQRTKYVDGHLVQRDAYSSFLLRCMETDNPEKIDSTKCNKEFPSFLVKQNKLIDKIKLEGDPTNNFGLKDILALKHKNVA